MIKKGDMVQSDYGFTGIVEQEFNNWDDLKDNNDFASIGNDDKDLWLIKQEKPFTVEQLYEKWFSIRCVDGGGIWSCESRLYKTNMN